MNLKNGMIVDGKNRCAVLISAGPWVEGIPPELIKLRCKKATGFPDWVRAAFEVENNSNSLEDYFENDVIRLMPGDPLYDDANDEALR
jgi:hypothetical protein